MILKLFNYTSTVISFIVMKIFPLFPLLEIVLLNHSYRFILNMRAYYYFSSPFAVYFSIFCAFFHLLKYIVYSYFCHINNNYLHTYFIIIFLNQYTYNIIVIRIKDNFKSYYEQNRDEIYIFFIF